MQSISKPPFSQGFMCGASRAGRPLKLPLVVGGVSPITYALAPVSSALTFDPLERLDFNAINRTLTATPHSTLIAYTATDANDAVFTRTFVLAVVPLVAFPDSLGVSIVTHFSYQCSLYFDFDKEIQPVVMLSATSGAPC